MSKFVDVEVIRHPVGADGTMRSRFTFNVSVDPDKYGEDANALFRNALVAAFADEMTRLRGEKGRLRVAFGTSREDGMPLPDVRLVDRDARQEQVFEWAKAAFTEVQVTSLSQRGLRLAEEAIEAAQACGVDPAQIHKLVDYVYGRPKGEIGQELGGVGVTLLSLAAAAGLSADTEERREVERVLSRPAEHWAARNKAKNEAGFLTADAAARAPEYADYHCVPVSRGSAGFTVLAASDPAAPVTEVDLGALLQPASAERESRHVRIQVGDETVTIAAPRSKPIPAEVVELEIAQSRQRQASPDAERATRAWVKISSRRPGINLQSILDLDAPSRDAAVEWATKIEPRLPILMLRDWLAMSPEQRAWVRDELCVQAGPDAPIGGA